MLHGQIVYVHSPVSVFSESSGSRKVLFWATVDPHLMSSTENNQNSNRYQYQLSSFDIKSNSKLLVWADSFFFVPNVLHLTVATLRNFECYITYICSRRQIHQRRFRHLYPPTGCTPRWCNKFHSLCRPHKRRWRTSQCWRWGKLKTRKRLMLEQLVYPIIFFLQLCFGSSWMQVYELSQNPFIPTRPSRWHAYCLFTISTWKLISF